MSADGIYSIVVSSELLTSVGVIAIESGVVRGNDNLGSTFEGKTKVTDGGMLLSLDVVMTTPPNIYQISDGSALDGQFQLRSIGFEVLLAEFASGRPFANDSHSITIVVRKLPLDYAPLAGEHGRWLQIGLLQAAERGWRERE